MTDYQSFGGFHFFFGITFNLQAGRPTTLRYV